MKNIFLLIAGLSTACAAGILADIDHMDSRVEWHGVSMLKVGDQVNLGDVHVGGFIEVRNDARFNQAALPNHNWRGYANVGFTHNIPVFAHGFIGLPAEFHHESAHGTMGIQGATTEAMEMIYDGQYRNINRNAFASGLDLGWNNVVAFTLQLRGFEYVRSRNTPESPSLALAYSQGLSVGGEFRYPVQKVTLIASGFFRHEFQGDRSAEVPIYYDSTGTAVTKMAIYPAMQSTNTFSGLVGVGFPLPNTNRIAMFYAQVINGNPGGFIDSREQVLQFGGGLSLTL